MATLKTTYLGLELKNPIIIGACDISQNTDNLKRIEEAGAAAVVYKSLFEEQIRLEQAQMQDELEEYTERHAEMVTLFPNIEHAGPEEHLVNLRKAKESISIPLIASLNAIYKESWLEYAKLIEETGVDGLELNFYSVPKDTDISGVSIEKQQIEILQEIKNTVTIPVAVKLSSFYTNPLNFIYNIDKAGADGLVLFNRFYQPDIEIAAEKHVSVHYLSSVWENKLPMRFAGLLYHYIAAGICCNSGIHDGEDVIKMILTGASCVQAVSTIYKNNISHISKMIKDVETWMEGKNYKLITDFQGLLSKKSINDPFVYQRAQYIEMLLNSEKQLMRQTLR
jgi:dihydroorotate dehydrogenase (fumarate)